MKTRLVSAIVAATLLFSMCMTVSATSLRSNNNYSTLYFSGTTANCGAFITAAGQRIHVVMELWNGSTRVGRWEVTQWDHMYLTRTKTVTSGPTYTLKVSGTIGSTAFSLPNITKTCG